MNGLTPGRMVHYVAYGTPGGEYPAGVHRAAIVTDVITHQEGKGNPVISLAVINPSGLLFILDVPYDATALRPGTWHWIEPA